MQKEYRNKCEFLISTGADGEDKTIGFRLGKYKGGSCAVVGPAETCHVSAEAKQVVGEFQKFIRYDYTIVHSQAWRWKTELLSHMIPFFHRQEAKSSIDSHQLSC